MNWSMSYSSSAYEMVRTTLLDCYRWEFSAVVQRQGPDAASGLEEETSRSCVFHHRRRRRAWQRRSARACGMLTACEMDALAVCDLVAATAASRGGGGVGASSEGGGGGIWSRGRRRVWRRSRWQGLEAETEAAAGSGGGSGGGGVWRFRRRL
jgi:hypothetical protein